MILLIDNNDSFTYNVLQLLQKVTNESVVIKRSSEITISQVRNYDHIIFSPGPGLPQDFPIMDEILDIYDNSKSILGICLGHQAICQHYGAKLRNLSHVVHGMESKITCTPSSILFNNMDSMVVGRYHSWVAESLPDELNVTATDETGLVMAVEHSTKQVYGIQFHPESYITKEGDKIIRNFLYGVF